MSSPGTESDLAAIAIGSTGLIFLSSPGTESDLAAIAIGSKGGLGSLFDCISTGSVGLILLSETVLTLFSDISGDGILSTDSSISSSSSENAEA